MDFTVFDKKKMDEYSRRAKEQWGKTAEYKQFEEKEASRSDEQQQNMMQEFMQIFVEFGQMKDAEPTDEKVQAQVKKL
ncbi:MAG: TipAS antibiotic-recognition domain-containing protein, partial [Clostridia bacterium]|nr:TipAS antibiotic-recognition domain-containing protein [Clostridia bacterium]